MEEEHLLQANESKRKKSPITSEDNDVKLPYDSSVKIETTQPNSEIPGQISNSPKQPDTQNLPIKSEYDDADAWRLTELKDPWKICKEDFDKNGKIDDALFGKVARPIPQQQSEKKKTPVHNPQGLKQTTLSDSRSTLTAAPIPQRHFTANHGGRAAARTKLEEAHQMYEETYLANLMEMEFGPNCSCNRYPWQHELHPSGTVKRDAERDQQGEDVEEVERDEA